MFYSVFEGSPFEGKEKLGEQFYMSLLPKLHEKFKDNGFHEDAFSGSPHARRGVNVAVWDDADAAWRWRNEENHLRVQKKGSDTVYESYRLRLGPEVTEVDNDPSTRQCLTLFYRNTGEGTPPDDVTEVLNDASDSQLKSEVVDSAVYQGSQTLWITAWRSWDAAAQFEKSVNPSSGDKFIRIRVERDYTKSDRKDAPHQTPGQS